MWNPYNPPSLNVLIVSQQWLRCHGLGAQQDRAALGTDFACGPCPLIILSCWIKYKFISGCGDRTRPHHPAQEAWKTSWWAEIVLKMWIPTSCFAMSSLAQIPSCWTLSTCPTTEHPTSVSAQHLTSAQNEKKAPVKARLTPSRMRKWVIQPLHRRFSTLWDIWRVSWPTTHIQITYMVKLGKTPAN